MGGPDGDACFCLALFCVCGLYSLLPVIDVVLAPLLIFTVLHLLPLRMARLAAGVPPATAIRGRAPFAAVYDVDVRNGGEDAGAEHVAYTCGPDTYFLLLALTPRRRPKHVSRHAGSPRTAGTGDTTDIRTTASCTGRRFDRPVSG